MIFRSVGPTAVFYRFHTPRWASRPLSGEGAAKHGGRFNRPGVPALYLSGDLLTAETEYRQAESLLPPATIVSYQITLGRVVDLSGGYKAGAWQLEWEDWSCDWRALAFNEGVEPPSWNLGDLAMQAGAQGVLFPSLRRTEPGALNLVIFTGTVTPLDSISVHDPRQELPHDHNSWPKRHC